MALSAGKSEIAINYVQVQPFSASPVSIERLARNVEKGRRQGRKSNSLNALMCTTECASKESRFLDRARGSCYFPSVAFRAFFRETLAREVMYGNSWN